VTDPSAAGGVPVTAIVLAAGSGRRFGGGKVLAQLGGRPLLAHVLDTVVAADVHDAVIVLPPSAVAGGLHAAARALLDARTSALRATLVENVDSAEGMSTSLRVGLEAAARLEHRPGGTGVVLLADQPGIEPEVVRAVVRACVDAGRPARAVYRDGAGPPVAVPLALVASVAERLTGDRGLRDLLEELEVIDVELDADMPRDVDRPEDLEALQQR
jgi:molybdenum cofactor cytidylyltransferase